MEAREMTVTIPVQITVRVGEATAPLARPTEMESTPPPTDAAEEAARPRNYHEGYRGYDPAFLETAVPLPKLTSEQRRNAAKNSGATPRRTAPPRATIRRSCPIHTSAW